jgi:hypothetical protein
MTTPDQPPATPPRRLALWGALLTLAGSLGLLGVIYVGNSRSSGAEHALIALGLAGSVLASAFAQAAIVIGVWMMWRSAHTTRR